MRTLSALSFVGVHDLVEFESMRDEMFGKRPQARYIAAAAFLFAVFVPAVLVTGWQFAQTASFAGAA